MDKRYQVFVSSTFRDLEAERQEVMHALLELDCMPAGMELFPAANESQWQLIRKVIEDCDYYILILGGRYGSIGPSGVGYTQMEYEHAISIGKPTISFLHRSPGKIIADKTETTSEGKEKLSAFRAAVEKKLCKHWDTPQELGSVVSRSLIQLIKANPAIGWVRGNEIGDPEELLRLRRRVEELESNLVHARTSAPKGAESLAQGEDEHEFRYTFKSSTPGEYATDWEAGLLLTWDEIFSQMAPLLMSEAPEITMKAAVNALIEASVLRSQNKSKDLKGKTLSNFSVESEDFQTIKIQLRALGLIVQSAKPRSVKDSRTYWTLTPYGDEVMTRLRAIRRIRSEVDDGAAIQASKRK